MKTDIVIGMQWGDEGKGKIVDLIAKDYDAIVRANGGNNAGHSISTGDKTFAVHSLPSGVLQKNKVNLIGPGCVVNPYAIIKEIETLGEDFKGELQIADRCPIILKSYIELEKEQEKKKEETGNSIGTTLKGIGPTYAALKNREAYFIGDLLNIDKAIKREGLKLEKEIQERKAELIEYKELIGKYICNSMDVIKEQELILLEGAQATMLDNLYGTYPYVTSSNTIASSLLTGSGLNHSNVRDVIGVTKLYTTRVGNGPFVTEDLGSDGDKIRKIGKEVGVSTGRQRRCGWLDLVQLEHAVQLNGVSKLAIMKSDVLDTFDVIKICVSYRHTKTNEEINYIPLDVSDYAPVYIEYEGWLETTYGMNNQKDLPKKLLLLLKTIASILEVKLAYISTGPERDSTIML